MTWDTWARRQVPAGPRGSEVASEPVLGTWVRRYEGRGEVPAPHLPQETDASCGPAALRSALAYHYPGMAPPEALLTEMAQTTEDGTAPEALAEVATTLGLTAVVQEGMTPDDLEREVRAGHLVIVGLQAWSEDQPKGYSHEWEHGHYVLCVGAELGRFTFVDPAIQEGSGLATLERHELEKRWHFTDMRGRRGLGIILDGPRDVEPVTGAVTTPMG